MKSKRVISLLLAGQMLSAPMAQATSLSLLDKAQREMQGKRRVVSVDNSASERPVIPSADLTAIPAVSASVVVTDPVESGMIPAASQEPVTTSPATDISQPPTSVPGVTTDTPTPGSEIGEGDLAVTPGMTTETPAPSETTSPPPTSTEGVTTETPMPGETTSPPPTPTEDVTTETPTPTESGNVVLPAPTESAATNTAGPAEEGTKETPPASETTPIETPVPTETQGVQVSPTASPNVGETDVIMPSPSPVPTEEPVLPPEMMLFAQPRDGANTTFDKAYVGYGYEIYRAGMPGVNGAARVSTGKFTYKDEKGNEHAEQAVFAVEKDPDAGEFGLDGYPYMGYTSGYLYEPDAPVMDMFGEQGSLQTDAKWGSKSSYTLSDIRIGVENFYIVDIPKSLTDIEAWLGRIPDYKFSNWAVSGWGPFLATKENQIWTYAGESDGTVTNSLQQLGNAGSSTMIPLLYGDWSGHPDYPLEDTLDADDLAAIRDTVVENDDLDTLKRDYGAYLQTPGLTTDCLSERYLLWYGPYSEPGVGSKSERELPIIAHWTLSDDAALASTLIDGVGVNAVDAADRTTVYNGIYEVKATEADSGTKVNLLDSLYSSRSDLGDPDKKVTFDAENGGDYYIRVNSDVVGITPEFITNEAFRALKYSDAVDELGAGAGVEISFRPAGTNVTTTFTYDGGNGPVRHQILNDYVDKDGKRYLLNNDQYPMRAMWTLGDVVVDDGNSETVDAATSYVPLALSHAVDKGAQEADVLRNYFNELTVTVTPPSGNSDASKVKTFTFYIQRLNDPKVIQNPGNTPRGMLVRDDVGNWTNAVAGYTAEQLKAETWDTFLNPSKYFPNKALAPYSFHSAETNNKGGKTHVPQDAIENSKGIYDSDLIYWPNAWSDNANYFTAVDGDPTGKENLDLSETAIVVYLDSSFVDPGFSLYDSQGEQVSFVDRAGQVNPNVTRSVVLNVASGSLGPQSLASGASNPEQGFYSGDGSGLDADKQEFQIVRRADGRDQIDLRGVKVVPGIYSIEYRYVDPLSGWEYTSGKKENFVDTDLAATFRRPLIILPAPGDVDMDGAVTPADAAALDKALKEKAGGSGFLVDNEILNLFMLRVCDVNNDGVVNEADVAKLRGYKDPKRVEDIHGIHPYFVRNVRCDAYYYIPLWSDLPAAAGQLPEIEATWRVRERTTLDDINNNAVLSLEYLGVHNSDYTDGTTLSQIKSTDDSGKAVGVDTNDIFWVGVKLSGLDKLAAQSALKQGISDITLTLAYDSSLLEPVSLKMGSFLERDWLELIKNYNVQPDGSTDTGHKYLWPAGYEVVTDGTWSVGGYHPHSSKAIIDGESDWGSISQMSITLHTDDGNPLREVSAGEDRYLLRLPFKVKVRDLEDKFMNAIDLVLSMQDFNLRTNGAWCAWDSTDAGIFGATVNLADELTYDNTLAVSTGRNIPLSEKTSAVVVELSNEARTDGKFIYGERVEISSLTAVVDGKSERVWPGSAEELQRLQHLMPKGLTMADAGQISGVLEETKEIHFSVDTHPYIFHFSVEKAPLNIMPVGQEIYYGEAYATLTYLYAPEMIKDVDKLGGANYDSVLAFDNNGRGKELAKLPGYKAPTLSADMEQGDDAGEYAISLTNAGDSGLDNYYFVYVNGEFDKDTGETKFTETTNATSATSPLIVDKRPIKINELTNTTTSVTFHVNEFQDTRHGIEATYQKGKASEFSMVDLSQDAAYKGLSGDPIYGDDKVTLTFTVKIQHDQDISGLPYYDLGGKPSDTRPITVSNLVLKAKTEGAAGEENNNRNYVLVPGSPVNNRPNATITANPIVKLEMRSEAPSTGPYEYGQSINFRGTKVRFTYAYPNISSDPDSIYSSDYQFNNDATFTNLGIYVTYETLEDIQKGTIHWDDKNYSLIDDTYHSKPLSTDVHNGKYICISVKGQVKDENGADKAGMVLWHSATPLVITRKAMELTASDALVYYGEYQSGMLDAHFTYNVAQLTQADRDIIKSKTGKEPTGASEELGYLSDYIAPVITAMDGGYSDGTPVTQDTPVRWDEAKGVPVAYNIYITDAKGGDGNATSGTTNYFFRYMKAGVAAEDGIGAAALTILPRPIYVDKVTLGKYTRTYLYDDTTVTTLETMTDGNGVSQKVTAAGLNTAVTGGATAEDDARANADTFIAKLPGAQYYEKGSYTSSETAVYGGKSVMAGTGKAGDPVLTGDAIYTNNSVLDKLILTYQAVYPVDNPYAAPPDGTFFELGGALEKFVDADIQAIALPRGSGNANANYHLVYGDQAPAISGGTPAAPKAQARIVLRPLESMTISSGPTKTDYTYGQAMTLGGMSLQLKLGSVGDNAPERNRSVISRIERYRDYNNGQNSFSEQGLKVYWMTDTLAAMSEADLKTFLTTPGNIDTLEEAREGSYPDVAKTGKKLLVVGRRTDAAGAEAAGHVLTFAVTDGWGLSVKKKTLPLTVEGINRYYGEPNGTFRAYYTFGDLAQPDQAKLLATSPALTGSSQLYLTAARDDSASTDRTSATPQDVSTTATSSELTRLNSVAPDLAVRFVTKGTQGSDVGQYTIDLEMLSGRNLDNYDFTAASSTSGQLRVFRRPIDVTKIYQNPISTIYNNTTERRFPASVDQAGQLQTTSGKTGFMAKLPVSSGRVYTSDDPEVTSAVTAGMPNTMTLTGDAIYSIGSSQDKLGLSMTVVFKEVANRAKFEGVNSTKYQIPDSVEIEGIALTGTKAKGYGSDNYWLVYGDESYGHAAGDRKLKGLPADTSAIGQLDRRPIESIRVTAMPTMEYTYGQPLNLNGLAVEVKYKQLSDYSSLDQKYDLYQTLSYRDLAGRLAVNYWDSPAPPAAPITDNTDPGYTASQQAYKDNVENCPAANGDHLTIMPSHEEKFRNKKTGELISHNGKYLLLTARENESMMYEAPAVLVCDPNAPDGTPARSAVPLTVNKLDLTYALTASDKTYNDPAYAGKTAAAGAITLTNVHTYSATDRDLVYVSTDVTDAAYSGYATDAAQLQSLKDDLNDAGKSNNDAYTFTAQGAAGSTGLTFTFYDENVVYFDDTYTANHKVAPENWYGYWLGADHSVKQPSDTGKWDVYGEVAPMPVLVSNIKLMGPDAGNYTLDEWVGRRDNVAARDPRSSGEANKSQTPYAKINKADQAIDLSAFSALPVVSVDAHSNVMKITYDADGANLAAIKASHSTDQHNAELHYEYGLQYMGKAADGSDPAVMTQWADWSDHVYFGGERMEAKNDPAYDAQEPSKEPGENDIIKGQVYPWGEDDKAFGTREPLDRNTVYWGMVKLAETHNYNESVPVFAYDVNDSDPTVASDAVTLQKAEAEAASAELTAEILSWAKTKPKEGDPEPTLEESPAVKTYKQSFKIVSNEKKKGKDGKDYLVETLESVWFTDVQRFEEKEELSAVLRNLVKTRYFAFYWDASKRTPVEITKAQVLDLSEANRPFRVEVEVPDETDPNKTVPAVVEVNIGDDPNDPKPNSAVLYVATSGGGGSLIPDKVTIVDPVVSGGAGGGAAGGSADGNGGFIYELSSDPVALKVEIKPAASMLEGLEWTSSNPEVIQVSRDGVITFVGVGTAEITATTRLSRKSASMTISVTDTVGRSQGIGTAYEAALALSQREENRFDFYYTGTIFNMEENYRFQPEREMARTELVTVLAQFYQRSKNWRWDKEPPFRDVPQEADHAEAVAMLKDAGVLVGLPDGSFGGELTASRAEVATILCRMMGLSSEERDEDERVFQDYGIEYDWAAKYIEPLAEAGVVKGVGDDRFDPGRAITRAELAAMLGRILLTGTNYGEEPIVPSDVEVEHWAYTLILRAVNEVVPKKLKNER